jgi:hypothetical protein
MPQPQADPPPGNDFSLDDMRASPLAASSNDPGLTQTVGSVTTAPSLARSLKAFIIQADGKDHEYFGESGIEVVPIAGCGLTPASPAYA